MPAPVSHKLVTLKMLKTPRISNRMLPLLGPNSVTPNSWKAMLAVFSNLMRSTAWSTEDVALLVQMYTDGMHRLCHLLFTGHIVPLKEGEHPSYRDFLRQHCPLRAEQLEIAAPSMADMHRLAAELRAASEAAEHATADDRDRAEARLADVTDSMRHHGLVTTSPAGFANGADVQSSSDVAYSFIN